MGKKGTEWLKSVVYLDEQRVKHVPLLENLIHFILN